MTMKKIIFTLLSVIALIPAMAGNNVAPWGWATCLDEAGTAYTLNGGNFTDATCPQPPNRQPTLNLEL